MTETATTERTIMTKSRYVIAYLSGAVVVYAYASALLGRFGL